MFLLVISPRPGAQPEWPQQDKRCSYYLEYSKGFRNLVSGTRGRDQIYIYCGGPGRTKGRVWMGGDDEKEGGILARMREGVLEKVAFGKSHPKLGDRWTDRPGAVWPQRADRGTWCFRGTKSESVVREGWGRVFF